MQKPVVIVIALGLLFTSVVKACFSTQLPKLLTESFLRLIMEIIPWEYWDPTSDKDFIKNFVWNGKDLEDFTKCSC